MKKALLVLIVFTLLIIINNLVRSIYDIWQKKDFVSEAQRELDFQKQENQRLKSQLSYSQTSEFIEKEARDKLFMVKQGEKRVLIPKEQEKLAQDKGENLPNWQQWWNLFF
ncbi:MAG: septum formation initiator family protein [bacterium]|nr:septum formation initiator family protein [bacterium]